ncbi:MBL fold metallo-hydrolase [Streptomyces sp. H10-C2]|uniref:MBL fold metallo-hydrolase n=1 Tax=unclassified Streptomyces TaxID=2593676 RepID=UPI0024BBA006|nr:MULTISPECIES: MBL fold metallo-hydrolase [unclassified Streptomyces]MDJ0343950.1 MBL fold metallo-hydrolase [Streptomyces sp. PH10-H1]MDJ0373391.1 MBL fold metallo-hydrolase [Streptomyces sp. H10-C2]
MKITVTHIGTATVLLEIGGLRLLTDPVFDPAPSEYPYGPIVLRSTVGPAIAAADLPQVDAVLLSHDEHADNLDVTGRTLLAGRPVVTTVSGAGRLGGAAIGLAPWATHELTVAGKTLRITGTPAEHIGDVVGFVLEVPGENEAVYVSGDTVHTGELDEIGRRFTVGTALLHLGAARFKEYNDSQLISMDGAQAAALTRSLGAHTVVPIHYTSWQHFTEDRADVTARFTDAGLADRLHWLTPGTPATLG